MTATTPTKADAMRAIAFANALHRARTIERRAHDEIRAVLLGGGVDPDTFDLAPSLPLPSTVITHDVAFVRECLTPLARVMAYVKQADKEGLHPHNLGAMLAGGDCLAEDGIIGVFPPGVDFDFAYDAVSWVGDVLHQAWQQY